MSLIQRSSVSQGETQRYQRYVDGCWCWKRQAIFPLTSTLCAGKQELSRGDDLGPVNRNHGEHNELAVGQSCKQMFSPASTVAQVYALGSSSTNFSSFETVPLGCDPLAPYDQRITFSCSFRRNHATESKSKPTSCSGGVFTGGGGGGPKVAGGTGFSGQWSEAKIAEDPALKATVDAATVALTEHLRQLKATYGDKLVLSSGATMEGVPKIIYDACAKEGIAAMGVACEKAFKYALGSMKYLIIEGAEWGAESPTFLKTSDEILVLGGGGQAKREAIAAGAEGKKVSVFQGYGGSADQLTATDIPTATFVSTVH